jgi:hypothetical protein
VGEEPRVAEFSYGLHGELAACERASFVGGGTQNPTECRYIGRFPTEPLAVRSCAAVETKRESDSVVVGDPVGERAPNGVDEAGPTPHRGDEAVAEGELLGARTIEKSRLFLGKEGGPLLFVGPSCASDREQGERFVAGTNARKDVAVDLMNRRPASGQRT